ncbi:MAG: type IV pilus secretin PilQ [Desulfobacter sp.]|nr:MAG: type IV pilus secretin PilQ [Desulfobacter sp.]
MKKSLQICIIVLMTMFLISGCKTTEKKAEKPDRFEKWRVLAEDSPKLTPDPRPMTEKLDRDAEEIVRALEEKQEAEAVPAKPPVKPLPKIRLTMKMHDVPVAVLLRTLARAADLNIMINETVTGQAKINIVNIPWNQAFEGLLSTYGLTYKWSGDILRVITVEDLNKEIALMEATQKFQKSKKEHALALREIARKAEKLEPLVTRVVKINFANICSLRENLEKYLKSNFKETELKKASMESGKSKTASSDSSEGFRGAILKDMNTNSLIIHATKADIQKIMPIIAKLDRPNRQILIEAHIVEATSETAKELGIQWGGLGEVSQSNGTKRHSIGGGQFTDFSQSLRDSDGNNQAYDPTDGSIVNFPVDVAASGMSLGVMTQKIGEYALYAQLTALEEEGELNILSKPSITTLDHRKATIESGEEVPFQTVEDGEVKIEWRKAVISLDVTPHVIDNKIVQLDIITHKDELDFTKTVNGNPTIITKNAQTMVNLFDGQTTVIGGLNKEKIEEGESGVPWLKDVPGLGYMFKTQKDAADMEELLIFITPHILEGKSELPAKVAAQ